MLFLRQPFLKQIIQTYTWIKHCLFSFELSPGSLLLSVAWIIAKCAGGFGFLSRLLALSAAICWRTSWRACNDEKRTKQNKINPIELLLGWSKTGTSAYCHCPQILWKWKNLTNFSQKNIRITLIFSWELTQQKLGEHNLALKWCYCQGRLAVSNGNMWFTPFGRLSYLTVGDAVLLRFIYHLKPLLLLTEFFSMPYSMKW